MSSKETEGKLPYNCNYTMHLSIGLCSGDRLETINPAENSSYTEDEWNALSRDEQEKWLQDETRDWAFNFIEYFWSIDR